MKVEGSTASEFEPEAAAFGRRVDSKAALKLRALKHPMRSLWLGLGVTGVIGWSVAVPTLIGAFLGLWLDQRNPGGRSWTLVLLVAGLCIGCFQAWNWVDQQDKSIREASGGNND